MAPHTKTKGLHAIGTKAAKRTSTKKPPTIFLEAIPSPILKVGSKFSDPTQFWVVDASGDRLYLLEKRVSSLKRTNTVVILPCKAIEEQPLAIEEQPLAIEEQPLDLFLFDGAFVLPSEITFKELFDETLGSEITNNSEVKLDFDLDFDFAGTEIPDLSILDELFPSGFSLEELEEIMEEPLQF